ncbi:hypothetical protein BC936DRAFT_148832 [Jimgerdemannia flammicorona]|uniref:Uncharacterized protein n=1 Tax=Jimgerdemannia flammicorona TaxID=994334 RepID=A0A433D273_9FUNG|nr:hypothetical protein BC936DRAFT_148832 [Jimgerdemannia flammicorona]
MSYLKHLPCHFKNGFRESSQAKKQTPATAST